MEDQFKYCGCVNVHWKLSISIVFYIFVQIFCQEICEINEVFHLMSSQKQKREIEGFEGDKSFFRTRTSFGLYDILDKNVDNV